MNKPTRNLINIIATGLIVTVLFSLGLFWVRLFFSYNLLDNLQEGTLWVSIRPSGLVPGEPAPQRIRQQNRIAPIPPSPNEPNTRFSGVFVSTGSEALLISAVNRPLQDIINKTIPLHDANERVYYWYYKGNYVCLDKQTGLMNRRYMLESGGPTKELFAGPNGISETPSASLGRFYEPIIKRGWDPNLLAFYDKTLRQFFVVDFVEGSVNKGLQLAKSDSREPIATGEIRKGFYTALVPNVIWNVPVTWNPEEQKWEPQLLLLPVDAQPNEEYNYSGWNRTYPFIPVLDKTGLIYNYNINDQSLVQVGHLPMPESMYETLRFDEVANPRDVLGYDIRQVYAVRRLPADSKKPSKISDVKYLGTIAACVSREGTSMSVAVFDPNGRMIGRGDTMNNGISTAESVYDGTPGSSLLTTILFLLENLQPPVFEAASYLCGNCFEAVAGHQALFILPNSFLGMLGRAATDRFLEKQILALLLICPSLILSVWFAGRIRKDAKLTGISNRAGKWWMAGTIAFGLPAYITYRLTRHKEVLVTCQNCGKMRRPDMDTCHRCGSKWEIPDLTPPSWRICD